MIIRNHQQGSEAWENERKGKATASQFDKILTPKTLKFSAQSKTYAIRLALERHGIESPQRPPSYEMEWGTEHEPHAREEYEKLNDCKVEQVGFCLPYEGAAYGMSPDGLIGQLGLVEIKCLQIETIVSYLLDPNKLVSEYWSQVQGQLWISQRRWCDLFVWHPDIEPIVERIEASDEWQIAMEDAMPKFLDSVNDIYNKINPRSVFGLNFEGVQSGN